jgi:hypothetical protein
LKLFYRFKGLPDGSEKHAEGPVHRVLWQICSAQPEQMMNKHLNDDSP